MKGMTWQWLQNLAIYQNQLLRVWFLRSKVCLNSILTLPLTVFESLGLTVSVTQFPHHRNGTNKFHQGMLWRLILFVFIKQNSVWYRLSCHINVYWIIIQEVRLLLDVTISNRFFWFWYSMILSHCSLEEKRDQSSVNSWTGRAESIQAPLLTHCQTSLNMN